MPDDKPQGRWSETRAACKRLSRSFRWLLIEWHLNRVVDLIHIDDPEALPMLEALSRCRGPGHQ